MAATIRSKRINEYVRRWNKEGATFHDRYVSIVSLLSTVRLSLRWRRWAEKRIHEMRIMYDDAARHKDLDYLEERNDLAKRKYETRIANREAERLKKKGWRFGKPPKPKVEDAPPAPVSAPAPATNNPADIWEIGIAAHEEEKTKHENQN